LETRAKYGPYKEFYDQIRDIPSLGSVTNTSWTTVYEPNYLKEKMQETRYRDALKEAKKIYKQRIIENSLSTSYEGMIKYYYELQQWRDAIASLGDD